MRRIGQRTIDHLRQVCELPDLSQTKYRLIERIAGGGMGSVFEVEDTELGRRVALKVLNIVDAEDGYSSQAAARMRNEARILARLEHPSIVPVHDVGTLPDGRAFYVMKLVRGTTLDALRDPEIPLPVRLRTFQKICDAVAFAHAAGVLHRDLKPENIMVGAFGEVLIMDWGVAKIPGDAEQHGTVLGTPSYMAPEQARGDVGSTDQRSDIYSLGAILRFLLADGPCSRPLRAICSRAMAEDSQDRYANATDLSADVGRYLDGLPVSAYPENIAERSLRWISRNRVAVILVVTYLVMRVFFILFFQR